MKKLLTIGFACAILAHVSCTTETENGNDMGELLLNIEGIVVDVATRSENPIPVTVDDLSVVITDAGGKERAKYASASDMPETVKLPKGTYKVSAYYGSATSAGFDAYYVYGDESFNIEPSTRTAVSLTCGVGNVQAAVYYGGNIAAKYKDYYVDIWETTTSSDEVRFVKDEQRVAFVPAGSVQLRVTFVKENGEKIISTPDPIDAAEATFLKLYLDIKDGSGDVSFKVTISNDIEDIDVDIELPSFLIPPASPELSTEGFAGESSDYSFTEGVDAESDVSIGIIAGGGIRSAVVVPSQELQEAGWPASFDLANSEIAAAIRSLGIDLTGDVAGATTSDIRFKRVVSLLRAKSNAIKYGFSLEVTDKLGQSTGLRSYSFTVAPPQFGLIQPGDGDAWATKVDISGSLTAGNTALLKAELKSGGSWVEYDISDLSLSEGSLTGSVKGLTPSTDYDVRLKYNSHYSSEFTFRTEDAVQVPNNDFETYCEYKWNPSSNMAQYYWHAEGAADADRWWCTRNPATASQVTGFAMGGAPNTYTRHNGATPVANGENGMAVQLQTTGWGRGTTSTANGGGNKKNITAAILYIGDYDFEYTETSGSASIGEGLMTSETITQGRPFTSRPSKFTFEYKYDRISGSSEYFLAYAIVEYRDGDTVYELGRASVPESTAVQAVSSMTDLSVDFVYNSDYKHLKATHISVFFSSSNKMAWKSGEDRPSTTNSGTGSRHYGNTLTIDKLRFDYDFE